MEDATPDPGIDAPDGSDAADGGADEPELSREPREASPPDLGDSDDSPIAQRRRERLEALRQESAPTEPDSAEREAQAAPLEDPLAVVGETVFDQAGRPFGKVDRVYAPSGEADHTMWVGVSVRKGMFAHDLAVLPLTRVKEHGGRLQVPYSSQHVLGGPTISSPDELSVEDQQALLSYYAVGRGDAPPESSGSYAGQDVEVNGSAQPVEPGR
jgi:hypothetical protein